MVVASLAALLVRSLPEIAEGSGIHWMKMVDKMKLIELWMEDVRECNEMKASRKDLLSVQKSTVIEWWLTLLSVQDKAYSMAAASSS